MKTSSIYRLCCEFRLAYITVILASFSSICAAQTQEPLKFDIAAVDKSANACTDFYQFACGGWLKKNPIPADRSYWAVFQQMREVNSRRIAEILDKAASHPTSPHEKKIGDYYTSCLDVKSIDTQDLRPLQPALAQVDAIKDLSDLSKQIARLHQAGSDALFMMGADQRLENATEVIAYLDQSGLNLPGPGYYTSSDPAMVKVREEYLQHLRGEFRLLGGNPDEATSAAEAVMKIESTLASTELTPVERRDRKAWYHLMQEQDLIAMAPTFRWQEYFSAIGFTPRGQLNVANPKYMQKIDELLKTTPIAAWRSYLRWELIRAATPVLPTRFRTVDFAFYQRTLSGVQSEPGRTRQCTDLTNRDLGEAVGREYADRYFPAPSKAKVLEMVQRIRAAFRSDLEQSTWLEASTKREALQKLDLVRAMIGYPDHWRDYSSLQIRRGDALGNAFRSQEFEFRRQLAKIGNPVDRGEFYELVQGVEGYHDNPLNVIVFTAGILQPPFFDPQIDDAINFGWAGAVMGHELSHAFDDEGHRFDGLGNMRNWWTAGDEQHYLARAQCFVDQYSAYPAVDELKVNGKLTLGENIADNGGLQLAHMAFETQPHSSQPIDGFTPEQRFFLGWAQWRCMNVTKQKARELAADDPHSPGQWRVNGVVSNMSSFADAYGCKKGDAMVRADPCRVW